MAKFAEGTGVSAEKSKVEIERILSRYGASQYMSGYNGNIAIIVFVAHNRQVKFELKLPQLSDFSGQRRGRGSRSSPQLAYDAEVRRLWRALALAIKAKLEVVASGISSFEQEFLANIVLPSGQTMGEWSVVALDQVYSGQNLPPLLGSGDMK